MLRTLFTVAALAACISSASAADHTFPLTGDNAKITFVGTKPGGKHEGGFAKLAGTATVTDGNPATLKLDVTIETDSLFSDNPMLTTHLKSPDFFAVKDHPRATFKTTKVEKSDKGYTITGDLTMLGKTKPVVMPATVTTSGDTLTLTSEFSIDRTDWGMSFGQGKVDNKVNLKVVVNAKK
jgi:polyisoprenoid-binding protein YceI